MFKIVYKNVFWGINSIFQSLIYQYDMKYNGAGDGIRTHDFNLGKVALYP